MTEIVLVIVIFLLLVKMFTTERQYLNHLKDLENKLAGIEKEGKVATPNEIAENPYMDIADVPPSKIINK